MRLPPAADFATAQDAENSYAKLRQTLVRVREDEHAINVKRRWYRTRSKSKNHTARARNELIFIRGTANGTRCRIGAKGSVETICAYQAHIQHQDSPVFFGESQRS